MARARHRLGSAPPATLTLVLAAFVSAAGFRTEHCRAEHAAARRALARAAAATVTQSELRDHAGLLAGDALEGREAGTRGGLAAARYLEARLQAAGLEPAGANAGYAQRFGANYQNVLALWPGHDPQPANDVIVLGAHYDHVGLGTPRNSKGPVGVIHNGADDNASGVAALLETIDALQQVGYRPRRTWLFAFWDAEEKGLLGSRHWVQQPTTPWERVKLAINVDMVGRLADGRLEVAGARTAAGLRQLLSGRDLAPELKLDFVWELKDNSDHFAFIERQVPAFCLHTGLHADYHRPSDDVERLNVPGLQAVTQYLVTVVSQLDAAAELPAFRAAARAETVAVQRQREALPPAPPARLGIRWNWEPRDVGGAVRVTWVQSGSVAERAGLRQGDAVVAIDDAKVASADQLPSAVLTAAEPLRLVVERPADFSAPPLGEPAPPASPPAPVIETLFVQLDGSPARIGIAWRDDSAEPGAVWLSRVLAYSPAARAGLEVRDRVTLVDGEPFGDSDALMERLQRVLAVQAPRVVLEIERAGRVFDVELDLRTTGAAKADAEL